MRRRLISNDEDLPILYKVPKQYVVFRALLVIATELVLNFLWFKQTQLILGVAILGAAIWLLHKNAEYIKGLLRLSDTIELTQDGITSNILGKSRFARWGEITQIGVDFAYWDGVRFNILLRTGEKIVFTSIISDALDAYNRIWKRTERKLQQL